MKQHRYILQPYQGSKTRHQCPSCSKPKTFAQYIDITSGDPIHPDVGRCNREDQCGYHLTPAQYFETNGIDHLSDTAFVPVVPKEPRPPISLDLSLMKKSLNDNEENHFVTYLAKLFGPAKAKEVAAKYFIGTFSHWSGATVFWQCDQKFNIRTSKVMLYNPETGKRVKQPFNHIQWVHSIMKAPGELKQCFFGEHLLLDKAPPVAIVESEKTAVIASVYFPDFIWLACGGLSMLNYEKCLGLKGRKVVLYPDLNGFDKWKEKADLFLPQITASYFVSPLLEKVAIDQERLSGLDLADYLIRYQVDQFAYKLAETQEKTKNDSEQGKEKEQLKTFLNELISKLPEYIPIELDSRLYPCFRTVVQIVLEGWESNPTSKYFRDRLREIIGMVKSQLETKSN